MTSPTILLAPHIHREEAPDFGDVIFQWDEPVTGYHLIMLGGDDIPARVFDDDGDATAFIEPRSMRTEMAKLAARKAGLGRAQADALYGAALHHDGSRATLPLDEALACVVAMLRWAAEDYSAWVDGLAAMPAEQAA